MADPEAAATSAPFVPSAVDVLVVKTMLTRASVLPFEIIDCIVELAEYWTCSRTFISYRDPARGKGEVVYRSDANKFLVRTPPVGFRRPPRPEYTVDDKIPPSAIEMEYEADDFKRYLGPLTPTLLHPVRRIVFTIRSHDQGWSSGHNRDGYLGSWTWFEAGTERFNKGSSCADEQAERQCKHRQLIDPDRCPPYCTLSPVLPTLQHTADGPPALQHSLLHDDALTIQRNRAATLEPTTHTVVWSSDDNIHPQSAAAVDLVKQGRGSGTGTGDFVRGLKVGDTVTVWAKARFPQWANHIHSVGVDVYWAV